MFDGLNPGADTGRRGRLAASGVVSTCLYGGLVLAVMLAPAAPKLVEQEENVEVTFQAPPPPTSPVEAAVPETLKVRKVARKRRKAKLVAPVEVPLEKPAEADAALDVIEVEDPTLAEPEPEPAPPPPPPEPPKPKPSVPIALPEDADPPEPDPDNARPEYPEEARSAGKEGTVILKIVVSHGGEVTKVQVLRGEEPFVSAAVNAVRTWRYEPARIGGQARSVFRIVRVPFRLRG